MQGNNFRKIPDYTPRDFINALGPTMFYLDSIKALGMYISRDLSWKTANLVRRIHYLSKWLPTKELVTMQYHLVVFYGSQLWIGCIDAKSWRRINSGHYRAKRAALRDYKLRKRSVIDAEAKRATPAQWS